MPKNAERQKTINKASFFYNEKDPLQIKLNTALHYVLHTCLVSSNKYKALMKTNGWGCFLNQRYLYSGKFAKSSNPGKPNIFNIGVSRDNGVLQYDQKKWGYKTKDRRPPVLIPEGNLYPAIAEQEKIQELGYALLALKTRWGNCGAMARLLIKYLWENHGGLVDRIEMVKITTLDHVLVIINRSESDLNKPEEWGAAWIMDCWYKESGLIFPAAEFKSTIKKIEHFAIRQLEKLTKMGITVNNHVDGPLCLASLLDFNPATYQYPTCSENPFYPIEYYMDLENEYSENLLNKMNAYAKEHKEKFAPCLEQINELLANRPL